MQVALVIIIYHCLQKHQMTIVWFVFLFNVSRKVNAQIIEDLKWFKFYLPIEKYHRPANHAYFVESF
jgi:hypothetical protein